ncbi:alpha/beta hydrolase [Maribacter arenosus]|uniref:Alpha/beta hydrolase n=1 Tax=Maribacter arenosus TaxID=1854708 RepID=A0ABR7VDJ0_9FLAO|nr:alpha/beta hydrolase [Maribacter arenosus]MBD0850935.1 alpha/beta hydrolase [Maribacter arenosus]
MKKNLFLIIFLASFSTYAQQLTFKKGVVMDSISVNDTIAESFALYLPTKFEVTKPSPILFIYDMQGRGEKVIRMFLTAAEKNQYVLAASNSINDSLSLSKNVLVSKRLFQTVFKLFNIQKGRVYTAGFNGGARMASVLPTFLSQIEGVVSCGSSIANTEVLSSKNPFHFIGIVGVEDFNYPNMLKIKSVFDFLKFPNQTLVFDGGQQWPSQELLTQAMELFDLKAMEKRVIPMDTAFIMETYTKNLNWTNRLISNNMPLEAYRKLNEIVEIYKPLITVDTLKNSLKALKRSSGYKNQKRNQSSILFKEELIRDDYNYYLEEDMLTYNYNNLGWWNYQMDELKKHKKSANIFQRQMGIRLEGYLNALIADNIDMVNAHSPLDEEALNFLWMLKTITAPEDYSAYLRVISLNAKVEDFGTALFYLEELLKIGYDNVDELYALENTALLRITPEFNALVDKYLKKARYDIIEE